MKSYGATTVQGAFKKLVSAMRNNGAAVMQGVNFVLHNGNLRGRSCQRILLKRSKETKTAPLGPCHLKYSWPY